MTDRPIAVPDSGTSSELPAEHAHPLGTLVIIALFGLFFAAVWLGTYVFVFLRRGTPHP